MRRREFIAGLAGAAATWPLVARAQERLRRIGVLLPAAADDAEFQARLAAFHQALALSGWTIGRNVRIEMRWAAADAAGVRRHAAELVALSPDVILAHGNTPIGALIQGTRTVPIVFAVAGDPVGTGLVASLARPGGNVTGLSIQATDTAGKRLELLREVVLGLRRLAILANVASPQAVQEMREVQATARTLGLEVATSEIRRAEDIAPAFDAFEGHADALYVVADPLVTTNRIRISTLSLGARLPMVYGQRENVEVGGLMSYGPNFPDLYRRAADYVDKVLRGVKPGDLPVEQPTKFDLVINLTAAKALGLTVPPTLLARADEVIE